MFSSSLDVAPVHANPRHGDFEPRLDYITPRRATMLLPGFQTWRKSLFRARNRRAVSSMDKRCRDRRGTI